MSREEALTVAILAINTLIHPEGSGPLEWDHIDRNGEEAIELLATIREELPA